MSLQQLTERLYVYRGGVNFSIIVAPEKRLLLIDSGLDSSAPRKALKEFFEQGYQLSAIINTHSHADHIGGNADLVKRTGCEVWAPAKERPFILWPELEPLGLYGGAWPPPLLQVKFLQAPPTPVVHELPAAPGTFEIAGVTLELIPVPGHALDQVAIAYEGVLIAADGLFKPEVIAKHPVIFLVNVADYIAGLNRISERPERWVVPGHGDVIDRQAEEGDPLPEVIQANRDSLERIQQAILGVLEAGSLTGEELLYRTVARLGKVLESEPQYFLDRAAIAAHVSDLLHRGLLKVIYEEGRRLVAR